MHGLKCHTHSDLPKMAMKLYIEPLSPVCRPVMLLLEKNAVPYQEVRLNLLKEERGDLLRVNPTNKVPAIDDNGFCLFESTAILRYIVTKYDLPDHWYPKELRSRARVDEALGWFPGNLNCKGFFYKVIFTKLTGCHASEEKIAECTATLKNSLAVVENYFLKDRKFVAGDEISIADLQFLGEVTQYWAMGQDLCKGKPNMERWVSACREFLGPHFDKVTATVLKIQEEGTMAAPHYEV